MKGYKEAQKIEDLIAKLIKKYPVNGDTAIEWLRFLRTIKTACQLLEEAIINDVLSGKIKRTG